MLHRLPVEDLRPGMFVVSLDCTWLQNPFWRSRFQITDADVIARMVAAGIEHVTIDDALGSGPTAALPPMPVPEHVAEPPAPLLIVERRAARRKSASDVDRARATVDKAKDAVVAMFEEARLGRAVQVAALTPMVDEIASAMERNRAAMLNVTRLKTKDEYTYLHSVAVCALMINLARQIGCDDEEVQALGIAGLLHDIGKVAMPPSVLSKAGPLDDDERRVIMSHPEIGHSFLQGSAEVTAVALDVCLHHHERVDGAGYPEGLTGDQLTRAARISAICDVYDAITSQRPYKQPWSPSDALARMASWTGHFDDDLFRAFVASIGIHPVGALVRLHSNRLALVLPCEDGDPITPPVRAFYDVCDARFVTPVNLSTNNSRGGDPIVRAERGEHWFRGEWPAVRARVEAFTVPVSERGRAPAGGASALVEARS
jgi:putative nucleotidyltransferase with HDIG domain